MSRVKEDNLHNVYAILIVNFKFQVLASCLHYEEQFEFELVNASDSSKIAVTLNRSIDVEGDAIAR